MEDNGKQRTAGRPSKDDTGRVMLRVSSMDDCLKQKHADSRGETDDSYRRTFAGLFSGSIGDGQRSDSSGWPSNKGDTSNNNELQDGTLENEQSEIERGRIRRRNKGEKSDIKAGRRSEKEEFNPHNILASLTTKWAPNLKSNSSINSANDPNLFWPREGTINGATIWCYASAWDIGRRGCLAIQRTSFDHLIESDRQLLRFLVMDGTNPRIFLESYHLAKMKGWQNSRIWGNDELPSQTLQDGKLQNDMNIKASAVRKATWNQKNGSLSLNIKVGDLPNHWKHKITQLQVAIADRTDDRTTTNKKSPFKGIRTLDKGCYDSLLPCSITMKNEEEDTAFPLARAMLSGTGTIDEDIVFPISFEGIPPIFLEAMRVCIREMDRQKTLMREMKKKYYENSKESAKDL